MAVPPAESAKAGHVSMMNDVLISQLPPHMLRQALRTLLTASHDNAALFTKTIRGALSKEPLQSASTSSSTRSIKGSRDGTDIETLRAILVEARIRFAAHLLPPALDFLAQIPERVIQNLAQTTQSSEALPAAELEEMLVQAAGDLLQAMQALKESSNPTQDKDVEPLLSALISMTARCDEALLGHQGTKRVLSNSPFTRALRAMDDTYYILYGRHSSYSPPASSSLSPLELVPSTRTLASTKLGTLKVPRLWFGLWQLSSPAWGTANSAKVDVALQDLVESGLTSADMADHYADAELLFGSFRNRISLPELRAKVTCATKYCQFARVPSDTEIDHAWVLQKVRERSRRVGGRVELLQVHWQYLDDERYLTVFKILKEITQSHPELLHSVGLCNFPSFAVDRIAQHQFASTGAVGIVSNQIQYSLIDQRPRFAMEQVCAKWGIKLITYGTFCGGFLSDRWVGRPEPDIYDGTLNTSQRKYFDMVRAWGGWALFQELLVVLDTIAKTNRVDVSNVASRWVLDQPQVGVVIIGTRLGVISHNASSLRTFDFEFTVQDRAAIDGVLERSRARAMFDQIGDCGDEYR